ncbi:GumC family protein [Tateyamaria pelophila]|uniref:GumC family protein n=1 Tax=Tateyamaria pelophila TaxID=328415 RepID=UPI001CC17005|nr:polysaccharide biosynthesis tyrosine autokinase [Tateyamaria pelophila]
MTEYPKNQQFAPSAPSAPDEADDSIDIGALIATLWRGKWLIGFVTGLAILIGGYQAYIVAVPLYRATASVILHSTEGNIAGLQNIGGGVGEASDVYSQVEVVKSRELMGKVVDRLDLVKDPEFNGRLRSSTPTPTMTYWALFKTKLKSWLKPAVPQSPTTPAVPPASDKDEQIRNEIISSLQGKVSVTQIEYTSVLNITVTSEVAAKAAYIADSIAQMYILNQIEVKFEATEQATVWLSNRVGELQINLEKSVKRVSDFSAQTELVSVEGLQGLERQIKELRDRIDTAQQARMVTARRLADLRAAVTNDEKLALSNDAQLARFAQTANENPTMQTAFDTRFSGIIDRAAFDLARADQQLAALETSEAGLDQQISRQGEDLITLQQLRREAEATQTLYEYFLTRLKETSAQQGIHQADSRLLSKAVVPGGPSEPRKSRILALSAIVGLMIGAGIVLLREIRNSSFRTAIDLEHHTGYSVMGQIPFIPEGKRANVLTYLSSKPTSAAAEAIRNLRTSLMLSNIDHPPKVILLTSSIPGEGKTTNAIALAQNLLGLGKSVLLLEGDIRRRTLHEYFSTLPSKGIVSVLSGDVTFENVVHRPEGFGADVLGGEKTYVNAADVFASDRFRDFIVEMRGRYDAIIIDTPPVLVVPDARIIAQVADAILFSVRWDKTSKHQVDEALRMFQNSNQRVTGLVLSQISARGMKSYGYSGQYGAYSEYGAKYYNT